MSLNSRIRAVLTEVAKDAGVPLLMAKPKYTGDNGAMIAGLAYYRRNHVADAMAHREQRQFARLCAMIRFK